MSKSIAVIDTPKECITCDLSKESWDEDMEEIIICSIKLNEIPYDGKATWCPLKPVPKKKDEHVKLKSWEITNIINSENRGYNNALKDILGEDDER